MQSVSHFEAKREFWLAKIALSTSSIVYWCCQITLLLVLQIDFGREKLLVFCGGLKEDDPPKGVTLLESVALLV